METALLIIILIFSVVIHEVAHGYSALYFGDMTAYYAGRLTLNPIKHLDLFGSIIVPLLLVLTSAGFIIGWAKPVPYNPRNLDNPRLHGMAVAAAGPLANIALALIFSVIIRSMNAAAVAPAVVEIFALVVLINIVLAFFNLIPIPPLDGSKILFGMLPPRFAHVQQFLERYGIFVLLLFIFLLWDVVAPVVFTLFRWFTGMGI